MKRAMKKSLKVLVLVAGVFLLLPISAQAGTFYTGVKYWQASWDSAILDWFEKDIAQTYRENRLVLVAHKDPGHGYLAGPLFGYQTDDRKWSFSFSPMVFSSFTQEWQGTSGFVDLQNTISMERKDFDLAASYAINKNLKGYLGYKYQDMKMDFDLRFKVPTTTFSQDFHYEVTSQVHIPTVGLAGVYQLSDHFVTGLQAGVLYAIPSLNMKESSLGIDQDIHPWPGLGFNTEATLTYQPIQNVLLQGGYRYQVFKMEARAPGRTETTKSYDVTHGWTLSANYVF